MNSSSKKGVLIMAYGSPDNQSEIEEYYTHIRGGRRPTPEELENLKQRYRAIGGRSPLLKFAKSTAKKLEMKLNASAGVNNVKVYAGMKHSHPFISETFREISSGSVTQLTAIALAPHYSKMSIGSYQDSVRKANDENGAKINIRYVDSWHLNEVFLEKWRRRIEEAYKNKFSQTERKANVFFLFTAHSLPERILTWNDPYRDQLLETANKLVDLLGLDSSNFGFAFQSAGHTAEPWLEPDLLDKMKQLQKTAWRNVLVIPIGFVSDHLEILYDIDIEAKELAKELGMHVERTESFNDDDDFIEVLASVVQSS